MRTGGQKRGGEGPGNLRNQTRPSRHGRGRADLLKFPNLFDELSVTV